MRRALGLASIVLLAVAAYGFSNTTRTVDDEYRWHHMTTTALNTSIMFRFPRKTTGSNAIPDSAAVVAGDTRSVDHVELIQYDLAGGSASDFVVFSKVWPAYDDVNEPSAVDTVRVNGFVRTRIVSGCRIDSVKYIGHATLTPLIGVTAAGGS